MSDPTKKPLTNKDVQILVRGKEVKLKRVLKSSLVNIMNEMIDTSISAREVHGDWIEDPRQCVAKYIKGSRVKEGLTQKIICKKLKFQQSNFSSIERGERPLPKNLITKLAKILNIDEKMITESLVAKRIRSSQT